MSIIRYGIPHWQQRGLISYYPLDGNVLDASGLRYHGTLVAGYGYGKGRVHKHALAFNGSTTYVDCGPSDYIGAITMSAWVYFGETPAWGAGQYRALMGNFSTSPSNYAGYGIVYGDSATSPAYTPYFQGGKTGGGLVQRFSATAGSAGWQHVACTFPGSGAAGSDAHIYRNGMLDDGISAGTATALQQPTNTNWNIGNWEKFAGLTFPAFGLISDARVYNRVLDANEIYELYEWRQQVAKRRTLIVVDVTSSNTTVSPTTGSIIVAGSAPTVKQNILRQPTVGSVVVAGAAPTVVQNVLRQPTVGSVVVTGNAPTVVTNTLRQPAAGSVIVAGNAPAVVTGGDSVVNPNTGTIVVSGLAPTLVVNTFRQPTVGSVVVAGLAPTVRQNVVRLPTVGSIVVAGLAPTVSATAHVTMTPSAGSIIVSGNAPTVVGASIWTNVSASSTSWSNASAASTIWTNI